MGCRFRVPAVTTPNTAVRNVSFTGNHHHHRRRRCRHCRLNLHTSASRIGLANHRPWQDTSYAAASPGGGFVGSPQALRREDGGVSMKGESTSPPLPPSAPDRPSSFWSAPGLFRGGVRHNELAKFGVAESYLWFVVDAGVGNGNENGIGASLPRAAQHTPTYADRAQSICGAKVSSA